LSKNERNFDFSQKKVSKSFGGINKVRTFAPAFAQKYVSSKARQEFFEIFT